MKNIPYFILCFFIAGNVFSQNCKIDNPMLIEKSNVNESFIAKKITELKKYYKQEDIKALEKQITSCNNNIDNSISKLKATVSNFSLDKQELLKMKDLKKIQEQIDEKQKSRDRIKEQIKSDLSTINLKGFYLCALKDLDPVSNSPAELSEKSKSFVAPLAIEFINGTFISSVSELYKNEKKESFTTYIKSTISGEMGIEKVALAKRTNGMTQFIYIAKISVAPLKKGIKTNEKTYGENKNNSLVINLLSEEDYKVKLKVFGISENDISDVENQLSIYKETIRDENETTKRQENNILLTGNSNIDKIDSEITTLQSQINNSGALAKSLIESKTNIKYIKEKHEVCINEALNFLDNKIQTTYQQIVDLKEQELIGMYDRNVSNEGVPTEEIAKAAINLYEQIKKNYSKLEQFLKIQELLNNEFTTNQEGQTKAAYREIEKIWLYIVPGDGNYKLTAIAQFKISTNNEINENQVNSLNKKNENSNKIKDENDTELKKEKGVLNKAESKNIKATPIESKIKPNATNKKNKQTIEADSLAATQQELLELIVNSYNSVNSESENNIKKNKQTLEADSLAAILAELTASTENSVPIYSDSDEGFKYKNEGTFIDPRDNETYGWIKIGKLIWMSENLNYNAIGSFCYDNNKVNCEKYGRLYEWGTAVWSCPKGWLVSTDEEWTQLTDYFGGLSTAGGNLKEEGLEDWNSPNVGADNSSGFSALANGYRDNYGKYRAIGDNGYWWSSTSYKTYNSWKRSIHHESRTVYRDNVSQNFAFGVRCVKVKDF